MAESVIVSEALEKYIHPTESEPTIRHRLRQYVHAGNAALRILMKAEDRRANSPRSAIMSSPSNVV